MAVCQDKEASSIFPPKGEAASRSSADGAKLVNGRPLSGAHKTERPESPEARSRRGQAAVAVALQRLDEWPRLDYEGTLSLQPMPPPEQRVGYTTNQSHSDRTES